MGRHLDPHGFLRCGIFSRCRFGRQDGLDIHPVDPGQVVSHIRHGQTGVHSGQIGIYGFVGLCLTLIKVTQNDQCFLPFPTCGIIDSALDHSGCQGVVVLPVKQKIA